MNRFYMTMPHPGQGRGRDRDGLRELYDMMGITEERGSQLAGEAIEVAELPDGRTAWRIVTEKSLGIAAARPHDAPDKLRVACTKCEWMGRRYGEGYVHPYRAVDGTTRQRGDLSLRTAVVLDPTAQPCPRCDSHVAVLEVDHSTRSTNDKQTP
jgi:hypothetical protein